MIAKRAFNALENKLGSLSPNDGFIAVMAIAGLVLILLGMFGLGMMVILSTLVFVLAYDAHYGTYRRKQAQIEYELAQILEDK